MLFRSQVQQCLNADGAGIMAEGAKLPETGGGRAWLVFYQTGKGIRKRSRAGSSGCPMPNRKSRETGGYKLYRK